MKFARLVFTELPRQKPLEGGVRTRWPRCLVRRVILVASVTLLHIVGQLNNDVICKELSSLFLTLTWPHSRTVRGVWDRHRHSQVDARSNSQLRSSRMGSLLGAYHRGHETVDNAGFPAQQAQPERGRRKGVFSCLMGLSFAGVVVAKARAESGIQPCGDAMVRLFDWVRQHGGRGLDNIEVRSFNKGGVLVRGLAVTRDIVMEVDPASGLPYAKPLFSIPKDIILHAEHPTVLSSPFGEAADLPVYIRVLGFLAVERRKILSGAQSFWEPYIGSLPTPQDFAQFHPLYANKELLDKFAVLPVADAVLQEMRFWEKMWTEDKERWMSLARKSGVTDLTYADLLWAHAILLSRRYASDWARPALVPISDLANADLRPNVWYRNGRVDGEPVSWRVDAIRSLGKGDEVLEDYRKDATNDVYFRFYGFLLPQNPNMMDTLNASACSSLREQAVSSENSIASSLESLAREACRS